MAKNSKAENSKAEHHTRVADLPQELYDVIFDLTFTASSGTVRIEHLSKGPKLALNLMQVSHATREQYGRSHYDNSTYIIRNPEVCEAWIMAMPDHHLGLLGKVWCLRSPTPVDRIHGRSFDQDIVIWKAIQCSLDIELVDNELLCSDHVLLEDLLEGIEEELERLSCAADGEDSARAGTVTRNELLKWDFADTCGDTSSTRSSQRS